MQQACGTGLEATILVANKIALGQADSGIAGGVDTASDAPLVVHEKLRRKLLRLGRARTAADRAKAVARTAPDRHRRPDPGNTEPRTGLSMGEHMAITAAQWGVTREAQDELALASHAEPGRRLRPRLLRRPHDPLPRPDPRPEPAARHHPREDGLAPAPSSAAGEDATMTAGNSTALTDGASTVLLGSEDWAAEHGLTPLAWFVDGETAAVDYVSGDEGLLMAPAYAVPRMLARNGLSLQDFDVYEIHEAFAATVLTTLAAWEDETFCRERLGLDAPARRDRPQPAEPERLLAGRRPPLRRHRRADRRRPGQGAAREGPGRARAGLGLRRRRPGRRRDPRGGLRWPAPTPTPPSSRAGWARSSLHPRAAPAGAAAPVRAGRPAARGARARRAATATPRRSPPSATGWPPPARTSSRRCPRRGGSAGSSST